MNRIKTVVTLFAVFLLLGCLAFLSLAGSLGDVDADEKVTASDARLVLRNTVGLEPFTDAQLLAADADGDGKITASDARLVLRAAVGLEELRQNEQEKQEEPGEQPPTECEHTYSAWKQKKNSVGVASGYHEKECTKCGKKQTQVCNYSASEREYKTENKTPTCTQEASYVVSCCVCLGKKRFTEPALGHSEIIIDEIAPTCVKEGKKLGFRCVVCNNIRENGTVPPLGHDYPSEWTVTDDGLRHYRICRREFCQNIEIHEASYTVKSSVLGENLAVPFCTVCHTAGSADKAVQLAAFNALVNSLKGDYMSETENDGLKNTFDSFSKTLMHSDLYDIRFGKASISSKSLEEEFQSILAEETSEAPVYSVLDKGCSLQYLPLDNASNVVSLLTENDVSSITASYYPKLEISELLKDFPDTVSAENGEISQSYSLTGYKQKTFYNVFSFTVKVQPYHGDSVSELDALNNGEKTSIGKITDIDLKKEIQMFDASRGYVLTQVSPDPNGAYTVTMDVKLNDLKANGTVTCYFCADTLAPVAAVYSTSIAMKQNMSVEFSLLNALPITGSLKADMETFNDRVYLFSAFFN